MLTPASALLAVQAAAPAAVVRPGRAALQECVTVEADPVPAGHSRSRRPGFSAQEVADIELTAQRQGPLSGRGLKLRLFLPDGHLYQKIGVRRASGSANPRSATVRFPVAGTAIAMSSLYGTWSVVPCLDGLPAACGPTNFVIRP